MNAPRPATPSPETHPLPPPASALRKDDSQSSQARRLSRMRADRVVAELVNLGVPQDRIQVLGRGTAPFVDVPLEARRVEIHIGPN